MALPPPRDLEPIGDVKGGSPRTPPRGIPVSSIPISEYQEYAPISPNGKMTIITLWIAIATAGWSLQVGTLLAWWTAYQSKGITQEKLEDYVDKHSPYLMDKAAILQSRSSQDTEIGRVAGKQERVIERLNVLESDEKNHTREIEGIHHDIKLVSDYLEQLKIKK